MTTQATDTEVIIGADPVQLPGRLTIPRGALGVVVFAHGSGSGRHSPRNRLVSESLQSRGCGTLLMDLLTAAEAEDRASVFNIELLADRVSAAVEWVQEQTETSHLPIGCFGASTGAAAALVAAAKMGPRIAAVVSRGGRPDLAGEALSRVTAPVLLLVGSLDERVLELNRSAAERLRCPHQLIIVPGASHLFEEHGTLERVANEAAMWFERHLTLDQS